MQDCPNVVQLEQELSEVRYVPDLHLKHWEVLQTAQLEYVVEHT